MVKNQIGVTNLSCQLINGKFSFYTHPTPLQFRSVYAIILTVKMSVKLHGTKIRLSKEKSGKNSQS